MSKTIQEIKVITKPVIQSKDANVILQENTRLFFNIIEKSITQYRQSMENLQQESIRSCRKILEYVILFQQNFAQKTGTTITIPDASQKISSDMIESFNKAYVMQTKTVITIFDTITQSIKALNDNSKSFAELSQSVTQLCIPDWSPNHN